MAKQEEIDAMCNAAKQRYTIAFEDGGIESFRSVLSSEIAAAFAVLAEKFQGPTGGLMGVMAVRRHTNRLLDSLEDHITGISE